MEIKVEKSHKICPDCKKEIDDEVCWCGDYINEHNVWFCGHNPVPMGCECGRIRQDEKDKILSNFKINR